MAAYDTLAYEDLFHEKNDVSDLHAFYMTQFNLELENGNKTKKDNFKFGNEESFDFEVLDNWNTNNNNNTDFEIIDQVIDSNINEQNIKEVLLDLDSIDFDSKSYKTETEKSSADVDTTLYETNDYIDDESLIDELCREESERLTPESNEDFGKETNILPSIDTFSKRYCNYNVEETPQPDYQNASSNSQVINSLEHYSYPNNILYNLDCGKNYILPDTPNSATEFNFERNERKTSVSESVESDAQSVNYSENLDEDDLFVNLDEFGFNFERENENVDTTYYTKACPVYSTERKPEKEKAQGERVCLWEHCLERYPNQSTLVEHIERAHVNTYKGDEFCCLWRECTRLRKPFNARYKLLIHMRVHSGHKPNRCHHPGCGKAFSRLENLKIHVRSHTGERPYACLAPHCRKAFSNSSDRAKHQRTHFNARPYACGAAGCGKRYTDPSSLRKHVKSHPHITNVPRTCIPPTRPLRRPEEQTVPSSPAKLTTLRSIRDKLTVPKLHRF